MNKSQSLKDLIFSPFFFACPYYLCITLWFFDIVLSLYSVVLFFFRVKNEYIGTKRWQEWFIGTTTAKKKSFCCDDNDKKEINFYSYGFRNFVLVSFLYYYF